MSLSTDQANRIQYLKSKQAEKAKAKQQAQEQGVPYRESVNVKEILNNGGQTIENRQKRLSDLYNKMYKIYKEGFSEDDKNRIYEDIGYDTMGNDEKEIVDGFLGGRTYKENLF